MYQYLIIILVLFLAFVFFGYKYNDPFLLVFGSIIVFFLGGIIITGSINILDDSKTCESVVANSTLTNGNNTVSYDYKSFCFSNTNEKITFRQVAFGIGIIGIGFYVLAQGLQSYFKKTSN